MKETVLQFRLTAADKRLIERAAARARRTVSDWVRLALVDAVRAELSNAKTEGGESNVKE